MPSDEEQQPVSVEYTPEFKRNLRQLAKRYRSIKTDLQPLLDALAQGQTPGNQIPGVVYEVYKVRASNTDSGKGKSGGYRVIYQRLTDSGIVLVTLYSKVDQEDIAPNDSRQILTDYAERPENVSEDIAESLPTDLSTE